MIKIYRIKYAVPVTAGAKRDSQDSRKTSSSSTSEPNDVFDMPLGKISSPLSCDR